MKASLTNTRFSQELSQTVTGLVNETRKMISVADVWNIQRQKKARVQRRFAL